MARPEYLYAHGRTSPAYVKYIYRVVGDTEKYWKCLIDASGDTFLVRKSNLKEQGEHTQYHTITKKEVDEYRQWVKLTAAVKRINIYTLTTRQLISIMAIAGGNNERQG